MELEHASERTNETNEKEVERKFHFSYIFPAHCYDCSELKANVLWFLCHYSILFPFHSLHLSFSSLLGVDELMKGAGKDATKLFDDVHAWVNYEQLLCKCFVGPLRTTLTINLDVSGNSSRAKSINQLASSTTPNGCFKAPFLPILNTVNSNKSPTKTDDAQSSISSEFSLNATIEIVPRFDWIQKTNEITLVFYTKALCNPGIVIRNLTDSLPKLLEISIHIERTMHQCTFQLADRVDFPPIATKINYDTGKIECIFRKCVPALWTNFGLMKPNKLTDLSNCTYLYNVIERVQITHDSYALVLEPKQSLVQTLPIGHHISITANVKGMVYSFCDNIRISCELNGIFQFIDSLQAPILHVVIHPYQNHMHQLAVKKRPIQVFIYIYWLRHMWMVL